MDSNDVNVLISKNIPWAKLPDNVKQVSHFFDIILKFNQFFNSIDSMI